MPTVTLRLRDFPDDADVIAESRPAWVALGELFPEFPSDAFRERALSIESDIEDFMVIHARAQGRSARLTWNSPKLTIQLVGSEHVVTLYTEPE